MIRLTAGMDYPVVPDDLEEEIRYDYEHLLLGYKFVVPCP